MVGSEKMIDYADDTPEAVRLRDQGIALGEPEGSGVSTNGSDADWIKGTHAGTWRASDSVGHVAPTVMTPSSGRSRHAGRVLRFAVKRTIDVAGATLALLALLPLMLAIAVAIVLESRGPVFYRGERLGTGGRRLRMLKFRKMHEGASGQALTLDRDPRLTRVGAILARTRLDELPQFWHVLRGDMSLVGPRPEDPRFASLMPDEFRRILSARPGMTGLSQLAFADERRILRREDAEAHYVSCLLPQKAALDGMYADRISIRRDLAILLATTVTLLLGLPIAVNRSTGALTLRRAPKGASAYVPERRGAAAALAVAEASGPALPIAAFAHPAEPEIVDAESADRPPQGPFVERPACVDLEYPLPSDEPRLSAQLRVRAH